MDNLDSLSRGELLEILDQVGGIVNSDASDEDIIANIKAAKGDQPAPMPTPVSEDVSLSEENEEPEEKPNRFNPFG